MRLRDFFAKRPVFRHEELVDFLESIGSKNKKTRELSLLHHGKTGRISRVKRGLYYVIPNGQSPATFQPDPYLLATRMTGDAVLAFHTSLDFYGKAYSTFEQLTYLTSSVTRPVTFQGRTYRGIVFPKALRDLRKENFGVEKADRLGLDVRITSLERTFVDLLDRPKLCGSWEEIWRSLESIEYFDLDKVIGYTQLLNNATTAAKVGFFLDQHKEPLWVEDHHLEELKRLKPKSPHYMERSKRAKGRLMADWNLVVPHEIVDKIWEEPSEDL